MLETIAREDGASVAAIARELEVHASTASRLVASLERHDLVERGDDGAVQLGVGLLRLASAARPRRDLTAIAGPVCEALAEELGETVNVAVLRGGVVVYATDLKHELAGVPPEVLERHGAVSAETARALASGAASRCGADVGLGLTGVAGPDEQEGQPVGTVHVGLCVPGRAVWSHRLELTGDRRRIREGACRAAMDILLDVARVPGEATSGDGSAPGQAR